jgi:hypothetical protein
MKRVSIVATHSQQIILFVPSRARQHLRVLFSVIFQLEKEVLNSMFIHKARVIPFDTRSSRLPAQKHVSILYLTLSTTFSKTCINTLTYLINTDNTLSNAKFLLTKARR